MICTDEVGVPAENVLVLQDWIGNMGRLLPVIFFVQATLTFLFGMCLWVMCLFKWGFWLFVLIIVGGSMCGVFILWWLNLVNCIWLTLAHGETSLEDGKTKSQRLQSVTVNELREALDAYIEECHGIENISRETFKARLRIVDPDEDIDGEEGEEVILLGNVTETLADTLIEAKLDELVSEAMKALKRQTFGNSKEQVKAENKYGGDIDENNYEEKDGIEAVVTSAPAGKEEEKGVEENRAPRWSSSQTIVDDERVVNKTKRVSSRASSFGAKSFAGDGRVITHDELTKDINDRAHRIRLTESQQIAPVGQIELALHKCGLTPWAKRCGIIPEWFDPAGKSLNLITRPCGWCTPLNIWCTPNPLT